MKNVNKVRIMAFAGVIIAMNIVLARLVAINIGPTLRITVSQTPVYLAGFWFGPVVGGICGFLGDLIGSLLQGYAPNPADFSICDLSRRDPGSFPSCDGEKGGAVESSRDSYHPWYCRRPRLYLYRSSYVLWNTLVCALCDPCSADDYAYSC